jgi:hypothetical protein
MFFLTIQVVHQFFHVFLVELLLPGLLQELHTAVAGRFDAAAQGAHDGTGFVQREHDGGGVLAACQKEEASTKSSQAMIVEWPCKANARQMQGKCKANVQNNNYNTNKNIARATTTAKGDPCLLRCGSVLISQVFKRSSTVSSQCLHSVFTVASTTTTIASFINPYQSFCWCHR